MLAPVPPEVPGQDSEEPVAHTEPRPLPSRARQDRELLPQQEVLGDELAPTPEGGADQTGEEDKVFEHPRR